MAKPISCMCTSARLARSASAAIERSAEFADGAPALCKGRHARVRMTYARVQMQWMWEFCGAEAEILSVVIRLGLHRCPTSQTARAMRVRVCALEYRQHHKSSTRAMRARCRQCEAIKSAKVGTVYVCTSSASSSSKPHLHGPRQSALHLESAR
ncbi:uncharacterized protein M421DRAFT_166357 [Didymella exigua CBS 183.55]|uniref:Uncharacterized protein n=1 Tax=Didymella exigua CBS 183.55 TaxID=1150837 RepID=A0A6A5RLZ5_9PLEO|nr:uncharacterized protein M421DRAFT_166357 [Didymella exigua CBS 183.55]KAF1928014.1 hypothetical protein M421DRAFT_166357 [Didymella exigua CBS 183.55]